MPEWGWERVKEWMLKAEPKKKKWKETRLRNTSKHNPYTERWTATAHKNAEKALQAIHDNVAARNAIQVDRAARTHLEGDVRRPRDEEDRDRGRVGRSHILAHVKGAAAGAQP